MSAAAKLKTDSVEFRLVGTKSSFVEDNLGLARAVAAKFVRIGRIEDSELYSVACLELVRAAETFDPSKSKFSTWATKMMTNGILSELRKNKRRADLRCMPDLDDLHIQKHSTGDREILPVHLAESIVCGNSDHSKILSRHYLDGESLAEIGRSLGISREAARKRLAKAILFTRKKHEAIIAEHAEYEGTDNEI